MKRLLTAVLCLGALAAPLLAQAQKDSLASLIESGNRKAALDKIRAGADVNEAQPDGTRPIHWAVFRVDYEILDALIAKKAKVSVTNEFGSTPLAEAVKLVDARMVKALLNAGAVPDAANSDGETPLMVAIKAGDLPIVEMLLKAGANVNVVEKFHMETPLMYAAAAPKNAGEMVKMLLAKDASVKPRALYTDWPSQITSEPRAQYRPIGGLTALLYAARDGCRACVEEMLASGADINVPTPEGVTPLMLALDNEHYDVAKLFLDRGANPDISDWWGRTALYIAVDRKEAATGGRGGAAGGRGAVAGRGAARAPAAGSVSSMDIINALLAGGVDPNTELNMHRPSRGGNSGRFAENQLSTGCTPLFRATQANDVEVMRALLAKGASPNINAMGFTPFLLAAGVAPGGRGAAPNMAMLDLMIQNGADVNAQVTGTQTYSMRVSRSPSTNEGSSALHAAVQAGRTELVKYLLDKGVNPNLVDGSGRKAIDLLNPGTRGTGAAPVAGARPGGGAPPAAGAAGGRGGGGGGIAPAAAAEIRTLLETAAKK